MEELETQRIELCTLLCKSNILPFKLYSLNIQETTRTFMIFTSVKFKLTLSTLFQHSDGLNLKYNGFEPLFK